MEGDTPAVLAAASEIAAALDEVPLPAGLLDDHGVIRWQNRAALVAHGQRASRHFTEFISPEDQLGAQAAFDGALESGMPVELFTHALDTGNYVGLLCSWNPIELGDGTRVVVILDLGSAPAASALADSRATVGLSLTRRQLEVLRLLEVGHSTSQIAEELTLSRTTVRNHIANLLVALGAHSRLQAVAAARASGILSD
jgi:DNA-binding CsgD family transcriptional regulator